MKLYKPIRWIGRKLRGSGWYVWNIAQACWLQNLRHRAEKPNQTRIKRTVYRLAITAELLLTTLGLFLLLQGLFQLVIYTLLVHFLFTELRLTWFPNYWR